MFCLPARSSLWGPSCIVCCFPNKGATLNNKGITTCNMLPCQRVALARQASAQGTISTWLAPASFPKLPLCKAHIEVAYPQDHILHNKWDREWIEKAGELRELSGVKEASEHHLLCSCPLHRVGRGSTQVFWSNCKAAAAYSQTCCQSTSTKS